MLATTPHNHDHEDHVNVSTLLSQLLNEQAERVRYYRKLEFSQKLMLEGKMTDATFMSECQHIISAFSSISKSIQSISHSLPSHLSPLVRRLQELEKEHFQLTVNKSTWVHETAKGERDFTVDIQDADRKLIRTRSDIEEVLSELKAELADVLPVS